ncbi:MAG: hypothetical protein Q4B80_01755 [Aerococcaceae bacterium]|nr:hypothetical protein [Aerococcaceae bacterium]
MIFLEHLRQRRHKKSTTLSEKRPEKYPIIRRYYVVSSVFLGMILSLFLVGGLLRPSATAEEYVLSNVLTSGGVSLWIDSKRMNETEDTVYLRLLLDERTLPAEQSVTLSIRPTFLGATKDQVDVQVYQGEHDYYEIVLQQLPPSWSSLRLHITAGSRARAAEFTLHRQSSNAPFLALNPNALFTQEAATLRSIEYDLSVQQALIETTIPETIASYQQEIQDFQTRLAELEQHKTYQTSKEKEDTLDMQRTVYQSMQRVEQQIQFEASRLQEATEKQQLLQQKLASYRTQFGLTEDAIHLE